MKDYSKMSDFEICGYVSMHENGFSWIEFDDETASHVKCGSEGSPGFAIVEVMGQVIIHAIVFVILTVLFIVGLALWSGV